MLLPDARFSQYLTNSVHYNWYASEIFFDLNNVNLRKLSQYFINKHETVINFLSLKETVNQSSAQLSKCLNQNLNLMYVIIHIVYITHDLDHYIFSITIIETSSSILMMTFQLWSSLQRSKNVNWHTIIKTLVHKQIDIRTHIHTHIIDVNYLSSNFILFSSIQIV